MKTEETKRRELVDVLVMSAVFLNAHPHKPGEVIRRYFQSGSFRNSEGLLSTLTAKDFQHWQYGAVPSHQHKRRRGYTKPIVEVVDVAVRHYNHGTGLTKKAKAALQKTIKKIDENYAKMVRTFEV